VLISLHTRPPVRTTPGIPCALLIFEGHELAKLGHMLPRECGAVAGRHCERSEAIQILRIQLWIASSLTLLAMTASRQNAV
jgi:hypothetical protein